MVQSSCKSCIKKFQIAVSEWGAHVEQAFDELSSDISISLTVPVAIFGVVANP